MEAGGGEMHYQKYLTVFTVKYLTRMIFLFLEWFISHWRLTSTYKKITMLVKQGVFCKRFLKGSFYDPFNAPAYRIWSCCMNLDDGRNLVVLPTMPDKAFHILFLEHSWLRSMECSPPISATFLLYHHRQTWING